MKKSFVYRISAFIALPVLALCISVCTVKDSDEKISEPFNYSGYSTAVFRSYTKTSEYVEMSDGTKLAVDIYLPTRGPR